MLLFKKLYRYGLQVNSHDWVKFVAMLAMFVDHSGLYIWDNNPYCRLFGRLAAPLFFFLVGYANSYKFKPDILLYGIALTGLTYFTEHHIYINILINFVFIKWLLASYRFDKLSGLQLASVFALLAVGLVFSDRWLEYGTIGSLFAIGGQLLVSKDVRARYWLPLTALLYFAAESLLFAFYKRPLFAASFALICLSFTTIMLLYRLKTWRINQGLSYPVLFISRYSLQIYFLHLAALEIYSYLRFI